RRSGRLFHGPCSRGRSGGGDLRRQRGQHAALTVLGVPGAGLRFGGRSMTATGEAPKGYASEGQAGRRPLAARLSGNAALAVLGTFAALAVSAMSGFPKLAQPGTDNDSVMRLVQVR